MKEQQAMATNNSKQFAENQLARFDPRFIQLATVMDNRDPTHSGKLKVWIEGSQSDRDSKDSWIEARYLAPFAGRTPGVPGANSYQQYPKGYGFWAVPPDVGCTVAVCFKQGRIFDAYWFACLYDERMNTMVPGMATEVMPNSGHDMPVPVTDYDRNTIQTNREEKYPNVPMIEGLKKQNLLYDEEAGVANRSSTRQTTSTVYGMSSPRGNSFILDDGYTDAELNAPTWADDPDGYQDTQFSNPVNDTTVGGRKNEGIVLRTRSGAQLLLSEASGDVLLINRDGTARIKFTADGDIDLYCDKNVNIRSGQDINFNATGSVNFDVGKDMNWRVAGATKLELLGSLDTKVSGQVVVNVGADLRLVTAASLRMQSGSNTDMTAGTTVSIKGETSANLIGGTTVNISGGGQTLTVDSSGNHGSAEFMAPNFKTPSVGLNDHIHYHSQFTDAENHSDAMNPPVNGGGRSSTTDPVQPEPANDVEVQTVPVQETEAVQFINTTEEVGEVMTQDLTQSPSEMTYPQTFEGLQMVMPVSGVIREFGYWGKQVPTDKGTQTNRNGWIIQAKGDVVAPDGGLITTVGKNGLVITHKSGYKSIFYGISTNLYNKDMVQKGAVIGTVNGVLNFEVRTRSANLFGFSGTVDPGLFYTTVTGQGEDAAGKSLTKGEVSNKNAPPITDSQSSVDSTDLVVIRKVSGIGSGYAQRGSKRIPRRTTAKRRSTSNASNEPPASRVDLSSIDKTKIGWKVQPSDNQLVSDIKEFEGNIGYQTSVGTFRNGRFWSYVDAHGLTIGYGHFLTRADGGFPNGITEAEAETILKKDLVSSVNSACQIYAEYKMQTPYMAQIVLTEMVFQLGAGSKTRGGGVRGFTNFLKALAAGNYKLAAHEMRDSTWYRQTRRRVEELARRIEACA